MEQRIVRKRPPTISDVARHAGVSPMTVSRVINSEANVKPATRELVNQAIAVLNYAPNQAARSLAGADPIRVGLIYTNPSSAFLSELFVGGLDQAGRANLQLVVERVSDEEGDPIAVVRHLAQGGIDGIILTPPVSDSAPVLSYLREIGLPAVFVAAGQPPEGLMAVSIDDHAAAKAMTQHIISLGHRRIGFIVGDRVQMASALRLEGYRDALMEAGLEASDALIAQGSFTYRSGMAAAERLLDADTPPTAIFASNDDMAAATVAVAHRRGLDVPSDLTVCGFDDTALATTLWPELTTIHQPINDMARAAVDLLARGIRDRRAGRGGTSEHLLLDFTLICRESDAPPSSTLERGRRRP